jgi:predicted hydrocarbon binding protein
VTTKSPSVRLPSRVLSLLADRCGEVGSEPHAVLREAGRLTGEQLLEELRPAADPEAAAPGAFWSEVSLALEERGLGSLEYRLMGSDLADLTLRGGAESANGSDRGRPGCPFSTGLLGGLLSSAAGEPMAVLEVECAADGAPGCRFLAGAEARLSRVGDRLQEGASVEEAARAP